MLNIVIIYAWTVIICCMKLSCGFLADENTVTLCQEYLLIINKNVYAYYPSFIIQIKTKNKKIVRGDNSLHHMENYMYYYYSRYKVNNYATRYTGILDC